MGMQRMGRRWPRKAYVLAAALAHTPLQQNSSDDVHPCTLLCVHAGSPMVPASSGQGHGMGAPAEDKVASLGHVQDACKAAACSRLGKLRGSNSSNKVAAHAGGANARAWSFSQTSELTGESLSGQSAGMLSTHSQNNMATLEAARCSVYRHFYENEAADCTSPTTDMTSGTPRDWGKGAQEGHDGVGFERDMWGSASAVPRHRLMCDLTKMPGLGLILYLAFYCNLPAAVAWAYVGRPHFRWA